MITKLVKTSVIVVIMAMVAILFMSVKTVSVDDDQVLIAAQKVSKSIIMNALDNINILTGLYDDPPTPFDGPGFSYADLSHPYFEAIRKDRRLTHFYTGIEDGLDFEHALILKEYLRDLFPHGAADKNYLNVNVLEMIDAAEMGEKYLCGNISKMLVQLIQAGGTQARTVGLQSAESGHIVVELWSNKFNKWALLDPDYNVHYTDQSGIPMSALDLYINSHKLDFNSNIIRHTGLSKNTLHNSNTRLIEDYYKKGFVINYYNRWVDKNYPRRHPARSPSIMGYYIGNSNVESFYYKHDSSVVTEDIKQTLYENPKSY